MAEALAIMSRGGHTLTLCSHPKKKIKMFTLVLILKRTVETQRFKSSDRRAEA